jgi:hypothetical protein
MINQNLFECDLFFYISFKCQDKNMLKSYNIDKLIQQYSFRPLGRQINKNYKQPKSFVKVILSYTSLSFAYQKTSYELHEVWILLLL